MEARSNRKFNALNALYSTIVINIILFDIALDGYNTQFLTF